MAARWDRSPVSRKMFMAAAAVGAAPGGLGGSGGGGGRLRGSGEDGESGRDVAGDVAKLPARARGSLGKLAAARPRPGPGP